MFPFRFYSRTPNPLNLLTLNKPCSTYMFEVLWKCTVSFVDICFYLCFERYTYMKMEELIERLLRYLTSLCLFILFIYRTTNKLGHLELLYSYKCAANVFPFHVPLISTENFLRKCYLERLSNNRWLERCILSINMYLNSQTKNVVINCKHWSFCYGSNSAILFPFTRESCSCLLEAEGKVS